MLEAIKSLARVCEPAALTHVDVSVRANTIEMTVTIENITNRSTAFRVATWLEREGWRIKGVECMGGDKGVVTAVSK